LISSAPSDFEFAGILKRPTRSPKPKNRLTLLHKGFDWPEALLPAQLLVLADEPLDVVEELSVFEMAWKPTFANGATNRALFCPWYFHWVQAGIRGA